MKILYKPFGIVLGIVAGIVSQKVFNAVWGIFDKEEPPKPTTEEAVWLKVLAAAATTFAHAASSVVGLGGSSLSKMPQTALNSFWLTMPARMPSTMPNGLYRIFMAGNLA